MFLPVALKHKEVDFSGLPVARRPSHRRHSGDSPWLWIVVPSRAAGEAVGQPRPAV